MTVVRIEDYKPDDPLPPVLGPGVGGLRPRPNTHMTVRCPNCGTDVDVDMEPNRKDPYENRDTGC